MNLTELFSDLDEIKHMRSRLDKGDILTDILSSDNSAVFTELCKFVYNPYRTLGFKVNSSTTGNVDNIKYVYDDAEVYGEFLHLLTSLETRAVTGYAARDEVGSFLTSIPAEYVTWFSAILNKDLKMGVGMKIIDKYIDDVAPKFDVQLCPSKQWDGITVPSCGYYVSPKIDGIRGVVGPFNDGKYTVLSRTGRLLNNAEHIIEELVCFADTYYRRNKVWPVFDGELYTDDWELSSSITSTETAHPKADLLMYYVFDLLGYDEWASGTCKQDFTSRDKELSNFLTNTSDCITHVPAILSHSSEEIKLLADAFVAEGFEGAVLKKADSLYAFKRSKSWLKYKPFFDVDVPIVGLNYAWMDDNNNIFNEDAHTIPVGSIRVVKSLIVSLNGVKTNIGSALSRHQRVLFAKEGEKLLANIVEVRYQRISADGCMIFPRLRRRPDK